MTHKKTGKTVRRGNKSRGAPLDGELRQLFRNRHTAHKGDFFQGTDVPDDSLVPGEVAGGGGGNFLRRVLYAA